MIETTTATTTWPTTASGAIAATIAAAAAPIAPKSAKNPRWCSSKKTSPTAMATHSTTNSAAPVRLHGERVRQRVVRVVALHQRRTRALQRVLQPYPHRVEPRDAVRHFRVLGARDALPLPAAGAEQFGDLVEAEACLLAEDDEGEPLDDGRRVLPAQSFAVVVIDQAPVFVETQARRC